MYSFDDELLEQYDQILQCSDSKATDAVSRILVAREQRKAAVGVAECLVRIKELDAAASVEVTQLKEENATARKRIEQEHKTLRLKRLANVMDLSVREQAHTAREAIVAQEQTKREAIGVQERVETLRIRSSNHSFHALVFAAFAMTLLARPWRRFRARVWSLSMVSATLALAWFQRNELLELLRPRHILVGFEKNMRFGIGQHCQSP